MSGTWRGWRIWYWPVAWAAVAAGAAMLAWYTPDEATMGPIQKVFYLHLPAAINMLAACGVVFVGGVGFLWYRDLWWDDLASAAAKVAVLLGIVTLVTGMIWARSAWGVWWTWSPRLTFTLILWLMYLVYVMVRPAVEPAERRAFASAIYGIVAFLNVPLVYLTSWLMPDDIHPTSIELAPAMKLTLAVWFVPVTMMTVGLILARFRMSRRLSAAQPDRATAAARLAPALSMTALDRNLRGGSPYPPR